MTLVVSGFHIFQGSFLVSHETIFFLQNFHIAEPFNLDYVIQFYKPRNGLSFPVFNYQDFSGRNLVAIRQIIKALSGDLPLAIECATMTSVNNVTKST